MKKQVALLLTIAACTVSFAAEQSKSIDPPKGPPPTENKDLPLGAQKNSNGGVSVPVGKKEKFISIDPLQNPKQGEKGGSVSVGTKF